ncbi:hypothetical protein [uncultured Albimonas sp.]|uniref:hypothetical protein n=1 Tax=uncultured Albimonas sp. TaxID=1331701 RepID=UPI0030EEFAF9|tara:strand:- start:4324 stop:4977 length:654 start_codon:yes stop_codon:yes gene_type:complete
MEAADRDLAIFAMGIAVTQANAGATVILITPEDGGDAFHAAAYRRSGERTMIAMSQGDAADLGGMGAVIALDRRFADTPSTRRLREPEAQLQRLRTLGIAADSLASLDRSPRPLDDRHALLRGFLLAAWGAADALDLLATETVERWQSNGVAALDGAALDRAFLPLQRKAHALGLDPQRFASEVAAQEALRWWRREAPAVMLPRGGIFADATVERAP